MINAPPILRQRGSFSVFAAFAVVVLIGFVGLAIDTGRALVIRTELQSAMDSCALSGVLELNGLADATKRADAVGRFVGAQRNSHDFQGSSVGLLNTDITFPTTLNDLAPPTAENADGTASRFIRCNVTSPGIVPLLLSVVGVGSFNLTVSATATVQSAQSICTIPMALFGDAGGGINYGYTAGDKIFLGGGETRGFFQWANVADDPALSSLDDYANAFTKFGSCETPTEVGRCLSLQSSQVPSLDEIWNARFGVYKSSGLEPAEAIPDVTGHGFPGRSDAVYDEYRTIFAPARAPAQSSAIPPGYFVPANTNSNFGASFRRLTVMPVVNAGDNSCGGSTSARRLIGWACVLMVSPITSNEIPQVEYIGRANAADTPCRTTGLPGSAGGGGPLVPVLAK